MVTAENVIAEYPLRTVSKESVEVLIGKIADVRAYFAQIHGEPLTVELVMGDAVTRATSGKRQKGAYLDQTDAQPGRFRTLRHFSLKPRLMLERKLLINN